MNSIEQLKLYKNDNTRCYYIDSDGDEVIVSDEEDFDVAFEYAENKGQDKFKLYKCSRQDESEDEKLEEPVLNTRSSLKMVADTVSVGAGDDLDSSEQSEDEIEELEPGQSILSRPSVPDEKELDIKLNSNVQETVSRDNSVIMNQEEIEDIDEKEKERFKSIAVSVIDPKDCNSDEQQNNFEQIENSDELEESLYNEFEILSQAKKVSGKVQDYVPQEQPEVVENKEPENELDGAEQIEFIAQANQYGVLEPDLEENKVNVNENALKDYERKSEIRQSLEEKQLLEMNGSLYQSKVQEKLDDKNEDIKQDDKKPDNLELLDDVDEEDKEFKDEPRLGLSVSVAKAKIIPSENKRDFSYLKKAIESIKFAFEDTNKRRKISSIDNTDEEYGIDHVVTCKPGKMTKKRWRVVNKSAICWPRDVYIVCQQKDADVQMPKITNRLCPGEKMDISINIKIDESENDNVVKVFVFRLHSKLYGAFGDPLIATVEVTPEIVQNPIDKMSQEDMLHEFLEGDNVNPILYEIANDLTEEGLGNFEECFKALIESKSNYKEAKEALLAKNQSTIQKND